MGGRAQTPDPHSPPSDPQASFFSPPDDIEPWESTEAHPGSGTFLTTKTAGTTGMAGISWKIKAWLLNCEA